MYTLKQTKTLLIDKNTFMHKSKDKNTYFYSIINKEKSNKNTVKETYRNKHVIHRHTQTIKKNIITNTQAQTN